MEIAERMPRVKERTGLGRSTIYDKLDPKSPRYDPTFPKPFKLGQRAIAWSSTSIDMWLATQIEASTVHTQGTKRALGVQVRNDKQ